MRRWPGLLLSIALFGCAAPQRMSGTDTSVRIDQPSTEDEVAGVHTDLVRTMLARKQYYAALAHIEDLRNRNGDSDELSMLEAEGLRELGRNAEATVIYRRLLRSRYSAEANHGLGLIYVRGNPSAGIDYLGTAVRQRPTDIEMRNDYGYALMQAGRYEAALTELATAMELAPGNSRARNNLLILLMLSGDEAGVQRVAASGGLDNAALAVLRRQAASLRSRTVAAGSQ
ncbi:tetratricopeptide repeat protein [Algiphilus sp. W345]|uniref:Tetratricopeptide repeat protein n=1 Tax=Banduia mediterranea TaxID=3075609 RepID=A0ABU2WI64_9GAMM|nr:tetratricopeptide repeat protein [Algiphilus sp. W345]MDT0496767.1 tetratricopeptide repeat protein [Algiphilus sp. W345]